MTDERKLAEILERNPRPPLAIGDWVTYQGRDLGMVRKVDCEPGVVQVLFAGEQEPLHVWMGKLELVAPVLEAGERVRHQGRGVGTVTAVWPGHADGYQADVTFDNRDGLVDTVGLTELRRVEDSAGPASSSASTGGLAEVLARLQAEVQSLAGMAQAAADVIEGQRRAAWDSLVESARREEQVPSDTQAGYTMGWRAAHDLMTGRHMEDHEYYALLAAELDSRYGPDRAKGGEPTIQPEPPVGAVVRDGKGGDVWQRYADRGWCCVTGGSLVRSGITWAELNEDFGPVELRSPPPKGGGPRG